MEWIGGRNCYQGQDGEYYPSSGWNFTRRLFTSEIGNEGYYDRRITVKAKLLVDEYKKTKYWNLSIYVNGAYALSIGDGKTNSLASCKRQASTLLGNINPVILALRWYYSKVNACRITTIGGTELAAMFRFNSADAPLIEADEFLVESVSNGQISKVLKRGGCIITEGVT